MISPALFFKVQELIKKLRSTKHKETNLKRSYPLSGLLKCKDGTNFHGMSGTGRNRIHYYYKNPNNGISLPAERIEKEALAVVGDIIRNDPALCGALARRAKVMDGKRSQLNTLKNFKEQAVAKIEGNIEAEESRFDQVLSNLKDPKALEKMTLRHVNKIQELEESKALLKEELANIMERLKEMDTEKLSVASLRKQASKILKLASKKEPVMFKNALKSIFGKIEVVETAQEEYQISFHISTAEHC